MCRSEFGLLGWIGIAREACRGRCGHRDSFNLVLDLASRPSVVAPGTSQGPGSESENLAVGDYTARGVGRSLAYADPSITSPPAATRLISDHPLSSSGPPRPSQLVTRAVDINNPRRAADRWLRARNGASPCRARVFPFFLLFFF